MELAQFKSELASSGFDEILEKNYAKNAVIDVHTHPFAARGFVTAGEMEIATQGAARLYRPGDIFELAPGQEHSERYGPDGATYVVGRKTARPT